MSIFQSIFSSNKSGAINAAIRSSASAVNQITSGHLEAVMPEAAKGHVNTDTGRILIGNILALLLRSLFPRSPLAQKFADELVTTSYQKITDKVADGVTELATPEAKTTENKEA